LKYYYVWNAEQITGIDFKVPTQTKAEIGTCEQLEQHIYNMETPINIKHKLSDQAYYTPTFDYINMPLKTQFKGTAEYYSTLIHEVVHSTGHSSRLNRLAVNDGKFDSKKHSYSFEELVAEIGSGMLCELSGVPMDIQNSQSYLNGWIKVLKSEPKWIIKAVSEAKKAVEFILGHKLEAEKVEAE
jgi:antirestriction protein ArdC